MLDKRVVEAIQNLVDAATYSEYSLYLSPVSEDETDQRFQQPFDENEFAVFPISNILFTSYTYEFFHIFQGNWAFHKELAGLDTPGIITILKKNPHARESET